MRSLVIFMYASFSLIWTGLAIHYSKVLSDYAAPGVYINNPMLYIAIESWSLLSLAISMLLVIKLAGEICRSDAG